MTDTTEYMDWLYKHCSVGDDAKRYFDISIEARNLAWAAWQAARATLVDQEPVIEGWRHNANEWADVATNGLQCLKNVQDGITGLDEAITYMKSEILRARATAPQPTADHIGGITDMVDAQGVRDAISVPPEVKAALNRMCSPLHESRLTGVTAQEDARCMKLIRDYILPGSSVRDSWISVDDRLPELETTVEIFRNGLVQLGERRREVPHYEDNYVAFDYWDDPNNDGQDWGDHEITHWQPLPAPPQKPVIEVKP